MGMGPQDWGVGQWGRGQWGGHRAGDEGPTCLGVTAEHVEPEDGGPGAGELVVVRDDDEGQRGGLWGERGSGWQSPGPPSPPAAPHTHLQLQLQPAVGVRQREGDEMQLLRHDQGTLRRGGTVGHCGAPAPPRPRSPHPAPHPPRQRLCRPCPTCCPSAPSASAGQERERVILGPGLGSRPRSPTLQRTRGSGWGPLPGTGSRRPAHPGDCPLPAGFCCSTSGC